MFIVQPHHGPQRQHTANSAKMNYLRPDITFPSIFYPIFNDFYSVTYLAMSFLFSRLVLKSAHCATWNNKQGATNKQAKHTKQQIWVTDASKDNWSMKHYFYQHMEIIQNILHIALHIVSQTNKIKTFRNTYITNRTDEIHCDWTPNACWMEDSPTGRTLEYFTWMMALKTVPVVITILLHSQH